MSDAARKLSEALQRHVHFATYPVGVKLVRNHEPAPPKAKYPLRDLGNVLTLCQGMAIARTYGWTMAFRKEDHACPVVAVFLGHIEPNIFLEGASTQRFSRGADQVAIEYDDDPLHCLKGRGHLRLPDGAGVVCGAGSVYKLGHGAKLDGWVGG